MNQTFALFCLILVAFCPAISNTAPPKDIPHDLVDEYTLNGSIPVAYLYFDDTYATPKIYTKELIDSYVQMALNKETNYYGETDLFVYQALDALKEDLKDKVVAVIGSVLPWYESVLLAYGACPVVIEYNSISCLDERITYLNPQQFLANPKKFDYVLSISSIEHDGLGRYGDPLDPNGDMRSMVEMKEMLTEKGKLIISFPVGPDYLVWNAHRIYGPLRLKMLFHGWKPLQYYGFSYEQFYEGDPGHIFQPVFVLTPK